MTDDLISMADVCEILADMYPTDGEAVISYKEIDKAFTKVRDLPSVPAVPLDKLCEWLENVFKDPPCMLDNMVQCKQECRGFQKVKYRECWRYFLEKWKEEQDATD